MVMVIFEVQILQFELKIILGTFGEYTAATMFSGLYYKNFRIVIYDHNDSVHYYKTINYDSSIINK
jgi:hypothetical protein